MRNLPCSFAPWLALATSALAPAQEAAPAPRPPVAAPARAFDLDPFAAALFRAAAPAGNTCISPFSVAMALGQLRAGARGATAAQIDAALRASGTEPAAQVSSAAGAIAPRRTRPRRGTDEEQETYALHVANGAFVAQDARLRAQYVADLQQWFAVSPQTLDFAAATARETINAWVAEQTKQRILDLLPHGTPGANDQLVLVSCVHLLAAWAMPFPARATVPAPFHLDGQTTVEVPTMHGILPTKHADLGACEVVRVATRDADLGLLLIIPKGTATLAEVESDLPRILAATPELAPIKLALPRFKLTCSLELRAALKELGMTDMLDARRADLSGITETASLHVSRVIHKTFVDVTESGIEAAAATAIVSRVGRPPRAHREVRVDRPFLFALHHAKAGALFVGRVVDPR